MDVKKYNTLLHLSALLGCFVPFANILAPLVMWVLKKEDSASVNEHGMDAINFQISLTIYLVVATIMCLFLVGILFIPILVVLSLVFPIIAAVKASEGKKYRYPMTIPFIKPSVIE